jgi:hypothetical protein
LTKRLRLAREGILRLVEPFAKLAQCFPSIAREPIGEVDQPTVDALGVVVVIRLV